MNTQMIVRIDPDLKAKVSNLARTEGKNTSELIRELLEGYVKERDIGSYIDGLWDRTGSRIKTRGFTQKDVAGVIHDVRSSR